MAPELIGTSGIAALLLLIVLRVPIAVAMAAVGLTGLVFVIALQPGVDPDFMRGFRAAFSSMGTTPFSTVAQFQLVTIPMFLLMGYFAFAAGFTRDIFQAARVWLSGVPGALAAAATIGCAAFAAVSGSSVATAAAMGKIAVPEMLKYKYDRGLATGVVAAAGTLGSLIPPSTLMILYAIFTEQSISKLFIAGVLPGILTAGMYIAMIVIRCTLNPALAPSIPASVQWQEKVRALKGSWGIVALFVLVLAGIYSGAVTPTEAGALGAAGALLLGIAGRRLDRVKIRQGLEGTVKQVAVIFAIIIGAFLMMTFVARSNMATGLTSYVLGFDLPPLVVVLGLSLVYVVLGTFMGPLEIMLLTVPVVTPIIKGLGFDLIWFGILMIKYLEIGMITPPVGLSVFVIKGVVGKDVELATIFRGVMWFIATDILTLLLLIFVPQISLYLPSLMKG